MQPNPTPRPRKPKYLDGEQSGRDRWLVSYTDIVTILLILFVAVAAQAMQKKAAPPPAPPPQAAPQPPPPPQVHSVLGDIEKKLREEGFELRLEERGLVISLPQAILFASGDDHLLPAANGMIAQIAEVLTSVPNKVALVGHADSVPIHNKRFRDNWELSAARSLNLLQLLNTQYGIDESRLSVQSYGSNAPKQSNDTAEGRAENRRVEILIMDDAAAINSQRSAPLPPASGGYAPHSESPTPEPRHS